MCDSTSDNIDTRKAISDKLQCFITSVKQLANSSGSQTLDTTLIRNWRCNWRLAPTPDQTLVDCRPMHISVAQPAIQLSPRFRGHGLSMLQLKRASLSSSPHGLMSLPGGASSAARCQNINSPSSAPQNASHLLSKFRLPNCRTLASPLNLAFNTASGPKPRRRRRSEFHRHPLHIFPLGNVLGALQARRRQHDCWSPQRVVIGSPELDLAKCANFVTATQGNWGRGENLETTCRYISTHSSFLTSTT